MAADLRVGDLPASLTPSFWDFLGTIWKAMGGRWGGDFRPEPDPNHFEVLTVTAGPVVMDGAVSRRFENQSGDDRRPREIPVRGSRVVLRSVG